MKVQVGDVFQVYQEYVSEWDIRCVFGWSAAELQMTPKNVKSVRRLGSCLAQSQVLCLVCARCMFFHLWALLHSAVATDGCNAPIRNASSAQRWGLGLLVEMVLGSPPELLKDLAHTLHDGLAA